MERVHRRSLLFLYHLNLNLDLMNHLYNVSGYKRSMGKKEVSDLQTMNHLEELEAESIYIMREVAAECEKPVMLYSIGKDSSSNSA